MVFAGPAIVEDPGTTVVIHPGQRGARSTATATSYRSRRRGRSHERYRRTTTDPITLEIIQNSLQAISRRDVRRDPQDRDERDHLRGARHGHRHHRRRGRDRLVRRRHPRLRRRARQGGEADHRRIPRARRHPPGDVFATNDPYLWRRHPPERHRAGDAGLRRAASSSPGRPTSRTGTTSAGWCRGRCPTRHGDLPGGPAAAGDQADRRGRADPPGDGDHEGEQPPAGLPAGDMWAAIAGGAHRRAADRRAGREVRRRDLPGRDAALHGLRRAGGAAARWPSCRRGRSSSPRSRTTAPSTV